MRLLLCAAKENRTALTGAIISDSRLVQINIVEEIKRYQNIRKKVSKRIYIYRDPQANQFQASTLATGQIS